MEKQQRKEDHMRLMKEFYVDHFLVNKDEVEAQKALSRRFSINHMKCKKFIRDW